MVVWYFRTASDRCPFLDFLAGLSTKQAAQIKADMVALGEHGINAPISKKPIKGHTPMWELRCGAYRVFYFIYDGEIWVLDGCKKDRQEATIITAAKRMREVMEGT